MIAGPNKWTPRNLKLTQFATNCGTCRCSIRCQTYLSENSDLVIVVGFHGGASCEPLSIILLTRTNDTLIQVQRRRTLEQSSTDKERRRKMSGFAKAREVRQNEYVTWKKNMVNDAC